MAVITPEILDEELKKSGRSQSALARAMGVDPAIVNRMVRGLRQIKAVELPLIESYLRDLYTSVTHSDCAAQHGLRWGHFSRPKCLIPIYGVQLSGFRSHQRVSFFIETKHPVDYLSGV